MMVPSVLLFVLRAAFWTEGWGKKFPRALCGFPRQIDLAVSDAKQGPEHAKAGKGDQAPPEIQHIGFFQGHRIFRQVSQLGVGGL